MLIEAGQLIAQSLGFSIKPELEAEGPVLLSPGGGLGNPSYESRWSKFLLPTAIRHDRFEDHKFRQGDKSAIHSGRSAALALFDGATDLAFGAASGFGVHALTDSSLFVSLASGVGGGLGLRFLVNLPENALFNKAHGVRLGRR